MVLDVSRLISVEPDILISHESLGLIQDYRSTSQHVSDWRSHLQGRITQAASHEIVVESVVGAVDEAAVVDVDVDVVAVGRRREVGDVVAEIGTLHLQEIQQLGE